MANRQSTMTPARGETGVSRRMPTAGNLPFVFAKARPEDRPPPQPWNIPLAYGRRKHERAVQFFKHAR
jgi:hypothetical protein